jgi:radical SAM superfamily enzyme YgiQ (UPF0313 family)
MSTRIDASADEVLEPAHLLMVVVTNHSTQLPAAECRECSLPELMLLEAIARRDGRSVSTLVEETSARAAVDADALHAFVEDLRKASVVRPATGGATAPAAPAAPATSPGDAGDPDTRYVLLSPLLFAVTGAGYEEHDAHGDVRVRLDATELVAARTFLDEVPLGKAYARQAKTLGELALDRSAFDGLVSRLLDAGFLRPFDPTDLAFRRGATRRKAIQAWESNGRAAVSAAIARSNERLDAAEREHRARTGVARPKVLPGFMQPTAWRMPPLALGMIMAYAMEHDGGALQELYDFRPDWILTEAKVDEYSAEPGVYLFSSYLWSGDKNLAMSAHVKTRNPWNVTIHGGPQVPKYEGDVIAYFAANPHVDIAVRNEGEITAAEILAALAPQIGKGPVDLSVLADVAGLSYRDGDGVVRTADRERLAGLDVVPSPYLTGLFDTFAEGWRELIEGSAGTDRFVTNLPAAIIETNRGCPYGCTFCDWGSATLSRIRQFSIDRVFAELDWCAQHGVHAIALADANFGIFARDVDITKKIAELKRSHGHPNHVGTNYAKNSVKHLRQIVETLADVDILSYGLLSLQSMDADTLGVINRSNIKLEKYEELSKEFRHADLPLYVDLMMGLPGQTMPAFARDLQECINREVHAKVFPTILLVNSPMNEPNYRELHGIVTEPGKRVLEAGSFTHDEYEAMLQLRRTFMVLEKYGVLRFVARYVRHETGRPEIDFFAGLVDATQDSPDRWPLITFAVGDLFRFMVPPVSWKLFLAEVRRYLVEELGVADDDALDTVLEVQEALLPTRGRRFPDTRSLPHDFAAWHDAMLDAKYDGHLDDWPDVVPHLRTFGPGSLTVEDPRNVSLYELGVNIEEDPFDSWDLHSPVSRAVAAQG